MNDLSEEKLAVQNISNKSKLEIPKAMYVKLKMFPVNMNFWKRNPKIIIFHAFQAQWK